MPKITLAQESSLTTLDIVESTITDSHDNYFISYSGISLRELRGDFDDFKQDYRILFGTSRKFDLKHGVLVIDLDENVWSPFGKGYSNKGFPLTQISKVIRTALTSKMTILVLSSGIHKPFDIRNYFHKNLGVSYHEFSKSFDIIVGCKTSARAYTESTVLMRLKRALSPSKHLKERALIDKDIRKARFAQGSKGKLFSAWLRSQVVYGERIGDIVVMDNDEYNIKNIFFSLEESGLLFNSSDFCGAVTVPSSYFLSRADIWRAVNSRMWSNIRYRKLKEAEAEKEALKKEEEAIQAKNLEKALSLISAPQIIKAATELKVKIKEIQVPHHQKTTFSFRSKSDLDPSTHASLYQDWVESLRGSKLEKEKESETGPWLKKSGCSVC